MPRMWMAPAETMCRKHLIAEHHEIHMFFGNIDRGRSLQGYIDKNLLEPSSLGLRHNYLVAEMKNRGYNHNSPVTQYDLDLLQLPEVKRYDNHRIDRAAALAELHARCPDCKAMYDAKV